MNFYFEFNRVIYRTVYYLYVVLTLKNAIITLERSIDVETTFKRRHVSCLLGVGSIIVKA